LGIDFPFLPSPDPAEPIQPEKQTGYEGQY
jgi:hypothetical protein